MIDEELFKAWKSEQYKDQSDEERFEFVEHLHTFPKHFEKTFLAGLKAGRPQWHKVADGDLPKGYCLVFYKDTSGENSYSIVHPSWYIAGIKAFFENNPRIIAWCEIPTFDKE